MGMEDHPSLSNMSPDERREYMQFAKLAGRDVPLPEVGKKSMATEELVYIDRDGLYGDATGLLVIKTSDLGEGGRQAFEKAKDQAEDLLTWVVGYLGASGVPIGATFVAHTSKLYPATVTKNSRGILKRLRGM